VTLVAFVASPLQALNLLEYSTRFSLDVDVVMLVGTSEIEPTSRTQIEAVLSLVRPRRIVYQGYGLSLKRLHRVHRDLASGVAELREYFSAGVQDVVVGEYRSAFSWAVLFRLGLAQRIVVVDDGTATLRIDRGRLVPRSRQEWRQTLQNVILLAIGIRGVVPPAGLTFFSQYALEGRTADNDVVVRNDYRTLSAELRSLPPDDESVYVIGAPYREAGAVAEGDLALALELTRFAADYTGKKVIYVAHRRERTEKLDALRQEVTVVVPNVPFEIYPRVTGKRPCTIVGYYTSVFVTAAELLGNRVEIISVRIPRDRLKNSFRPFVDGVYRYYETELSNAVRIIERPASFPAASAENGEASS